MKKLNLKNLLPIILLFFVGCGSSKIAYIDTSTVIAKFPKTQEITKQIKKQTAAMEKELGKLKKDIEKLKSGLDTMQKTLTAAQKKSLQKQIKDKESVFSELYYKYKTKMTNMENQLMTPVYKQLNKLINEYGSKNGYDIIFGTTSNGNIVYAKKSKDITIAVMKYIEKKLTAVKAKKNAKRKKTKN